MVYPKTKRTGLENTMSELTLNHTARLTDALERDLLRGALENQPNAHPLLSLKKAGRLWSPASPPCSPSSTKSTNR